MKKVHFKSLVSFQILYYPAYFRGLPFLWYVSKCDGPLFRLPFSFVTSDVVEATCACLLAQAEEADRQTMPPVVQERMVIEEFGRCLMQIIDSANRTKGMDSS